MKTHTSTSTKTSTFTKVALAAGAAAIAAGLGYLAIGQDDKGICANYPEFCKRYVPWIANTEDIDSATIQYRSNQVQETEPVQESEPTIGTAEQNEGGIIQQLMDTFSGSDENVYIDDSEVGSDDLSDEELKKKLNADDVSSAN